MNNTDTNTITIDNIQDYTMVIEEDQLILTRTIPYVEEWELFECHLEHSKIIECMVNGEKIKAKSFIGLIVYLYSFIHIETVLLNSILRVTKAELDVDDRKGYKYYPQLGFSIQGADTRRLLKELYNIKKYEPDFEVDLKLSLHLLPFQTPTKSAVLSGRGVAFSALQMQKGVKKSTKLTTFF